MEKIKYIKVKSEKTRLSNVVIDHNGKLAYTTPLFGQILRRMAVDFPIMCWYMMLGMATIFSRSIWAIMHRDLTVTHKVDMLIYIFLLIVSAFFILAMLGVSYYMAREKIKTGTEEVTDRKGPA